MSEQQLQADVAKLNLLNPRQRELVQADIENMERALYGDAMRYTGGDALAAMYVPMGRGEDGERGDMTPEMNVINRRPSPTIPEPEKMRHNLVADQRTLQLGTAPEFSGHRKNLLHKVYKQAVEQYKDGLLSHGQMWDANIANIHHHMRHEEANRQRGKFIVNMRKIFEPQEDDFSLDELRPHDPIRINSAAFRRQFDDIQWTEPDEMTRRVGELDNETYYAFLELKAQTQDSSVIMSKLMIDRATYEACEARLQAKHVDLGEADQDGSPDAQEAQAVPEEHIEAIITVVMTHPNLEYHALLKGTPLKEYDMQISDFARALKAATALGFVTKSDGKYVLAKDLTDDVEPKTVSATSDTEE